MNDTACLVHGSVERIFSFLLPEEVDMLRDTFIFMDRDSDGFLSWSELVDIVKYYVSSDRFCPLMEYLEPLFVVADKDHDGKLSLTDFLLSFADGPGVVPMDVAYACVSMVRVRLSDEELSALQENFRCIDRDADGYLDRHELKAALKDTLLPKFHDLTESIFDEIVGVVMECCDTNRDGKLSLSEFVRSFQENHGVLPLAFLESPALHSVRELSSHEVEALRECFSALDKKRNGYVDFVAIYDALWSALIEGVLDTHAVRRLRDLVMVTADGCSFSRLPLSDFISLFTPNMNLIPCSSTVVGGKVLSAFDKLRAMYHSGELAQFVAVSASVDVNNEGFFDRAILTRTLTHLFSDAFPLDEEAMLNSVMVALVAGAENRSDVRLSVEEFIYSFRKDSDVNVAAVFQQGKGDPSATPNIGTLTDDDLERIGSVLRDLRSSTDMHGEVMAADLHRAISNALCNDVTKVEDVYQYVLHDSVCDRLCSRVIWKSRDGYSNDCMQNADCGRFASVDSESGPSTIAVAGNHAEKVLNGIVGADDTCSTMVFSVSAVAAPLSLPTPPPLSAHTPPVDVHSEALVCETPVHSPSKEGAERGSTTVSHTGIAAALPVLEDAQNEPSDNLTVNSQLSASFVCAASYPCGAAADVVATMPTEVHAADALYTFDDSPCKITSPLPLSWELYSRPPHHNCDGEQFDEELRELFKKYDANNLGYLDRESFKQAYCSMEHYGATPKPKEVEYLFKRYSRGSSKLSYNEFCVLMLQRARM